MSLKPAHQTKHQPVRPLSQLKVTGIVGVFTDVDDTLTEHGLLAPSTFAALHRLKQAGFLVVPVTGRSSGWGHMMMSNWPVHAVVAESGGTIFYRDQFQRIQMKLYSDDAEVLASHHRERARLMQLCESLIAAEPGFKFALDNAFRIADVAIDYNESVDRVSDVIVQGAIDQIHAAGFQAKASSIHINAWFGHFDKAPTALKVLQQLPAELSNPDQWVFIGDAPNDASMFAAFANSIAVANIKPHLNSPALTASPQFICQQSFGAGFEELAQHLLENKLT